MKKFSFVLVFAVLASVVSAEVVKNINNLVAGTLSTVLTATEKNTVTKLTIRGTVDARDFYCMRDLMPALADVDLKETNIVAYPAGNSAAGAIPDYAFGTIEGRPLLKSFVFPKWAETVGDGAFRNCTGLKAISLDSAVNTVGFESFKNCTSMTSLQLSDCLNTIKPFAFEGCTALTGKLIIPDAVDFIDESAFSNCSKLTEVLIGSSVDSIGSYAFARCYDLKTIRFMSERSTKLSIGVFTNIAAGSIIYVPDGMYKTYNLAKDSSWQVDVTTLYEYKARVSSQSAIKQTNTSVKFTGSIDFISDEPIIMHGFCWSKTSQTPTMMDVLIDNGTTATLGNFYSIVNTLTPGTTYFIRAFVYDRYGANYGKLIKYTTPILPLAAGTIVGKDTVAQGQSGVTYSVPAITHATSYVWTLPSGATGSSTTNIITVSFSKTAVSGSISVFGRNSNGDGAASSFSVAVNPLPKDAGTITGYSQVCQGESQVTYTVPAIDQATSYVWTLPVGATGTSITNSIVVNYGKTAVSGAVTVAGKSIWGQGTASSLAVTVHQLPVIELRDTSLTYSSTLTLKPVVTYTEGGTLKYKWTPATGLSGDSIANPVVTVNGNITYSLSITTPSGCSASKDVSIRLKAMDKPSIGIVSVVLNQNRIAWNKPVSQGVASYLIYKETTVSDVYEKIGTVAYDSLSVFVDNNSMANVKSNKYKISVLDKGGVESPASDPHKTMHLAINRGRDHTWNLIWEPYVGFIPATYNIYRGTSPNNLNFLDATSGSSSQYTDLDAPATDVFYQLEVISPNLVNPSKGVALRSAMITYNASRSNVAYGVIGALEETASSLSIYPNPVKDVLNIECNGGSSYEMMDLTGRLVVKGDLKERAVLNTSALKSGLYVIKVKVGKGFEFRKVVKE